jgi:predicted enzyme related to lactoylglutathione lyase
VLVLGNSYFTSITVGIKVKNLEEATSWYKKFLNKSEGISPSEDIIEFEIIEGYWLQLIEDKNVHGNNCVFRLGVEDIEEEHKRITSLGIEVEQINRIEGVVAYCNFKDPFGMTLPYIKLFN